LKKSRFYCFFMYKPVENTILTIFRLFWPRYAIFAYDIKFKHTLRTSADHMRVFSTLFDGYLTKKRRIYGILAPTKLIFHGCVQISTNPDHLLEGGLRGLKFFWGFLEVITDNFYKWSEGRQAFLKIFYKRDIFKNLPKIVIFEHFFLHT